MRRGRTIKLQLNVNKYIKQAQMNGRTSTFYAKIISDKKPVRFVLSPVKFARMWIPPRSYFKSVGRCRHMCEHIAVKHDCLCWRSQPIVGSLSLNSTTNLQCWVCLVIFTQWKKEEKKKEDWRSTRYVANTCHQQPLNTEAFCSLATIGIQRWQSHACQTKRGEGVAGGTQQSECRGKY